MQHWCPLWQLNNVNATKKKNDSKKNGQWMKTKTGRIRHKNKEKKWMKYLIKEKMNARWKIYKKKWTGDDKKHGGKVQKIQENERKMKENGKIKD